MIIFFSYCNIIINKRVKNMEIPFWNEILELIAENAKGNLTL